MPSQSTRKHPIVRDIPRGIGYQKEGPGFSVVLKRQLIARYSRVPPLPSTNLISRFEEKKDPSV